MLVFINVLPGIDSPATDGRRASRPIHQGGSRRTGWARFMLGHPDHDRRVG